MSSRTEDIQKAAEEAVSDKSKIEAYVEDFQGKSRMKRQSSAAVLAEVARRDSGLIAPYMQIFVDSLELPEAQTRWEALDILTETCVSDTRTAEKAIVGAEDALFDEDSGPLRLSAMKFLCKLGATTENRSEKVWPLIDEAIQCYHGDPEYNEMLVALIDFSDGKLSKDVKEQFAARMKFDAENGKGVLGKRSAAVYSNLA